MNSTKDASRFDYLRNRPFLVIETITQPSGSARTERKGWQKTPGNLHVEEKPYMVARISTNIIKRAAAIIDVVNDTVVKNRLGLKSEILLDHAKSKYGSMIQQSKDAWEAQRA